MCCILVVAVVVIIPVVDAPALFILYRLPLAAIMQYARLGYGHRNKQARARYYCFYHSRHRFESCAQELYARHCCIDNAILVTLSSLINLSHSILCPVVLNVRFRSM